MERKDQAQIDGVKPEEPKAQWLPPELCRFDAGAAEFGDFVSADAQPGFS